MLKDFAEAPGTEQSRAVENLDQNDLALRPHYQPEQIGTHRGQKSQIRLSKFSAGGKNFAQLAWWLVGLAAPVAS